MQRSVEFSSNKLLFSFCRCLKTPCFKCGFPDRPLFVPLIPEVIKLYFLHVGTWIGSNAVPNGCTCTDAILHPILKVNTNDQERIISNTVIVQTYLYQTKSSANLGILVFFLSKIGCIQCINHSLEKSFCNNFVNSKLKSKTPLEKRLHLKTPLKFQNDQ